MESTIKKMMTETAPLENHLMWVAGVNGSLFELHFCKLEYQSKELPGWSGIPDLMDVVPDFLALCCPGSATQIVVRHRDVVYLVLCTNGKAKLIVGLKPQTEIGKSCTAILNQGFYREALPGTRVEAAAEFLQDPKFGGT